MTSDSNQPQRDPPPQGAGEEEARAPLTNPSALLLVDLQRDYLNGASLTPPAEAVIERAAILLAGFRRLGLPVFHVQTLIRPDGFNRMPHWRESNRWACVDGTPGARPPNPLAPLPHEPVFAKPFYSGFAHPELHQILKQKAVETVVIAGVHTHGCVRATALDAYQAGFTVWVAGDAVGSYDPLHAAISQNHLEGRICRFFDSAQILRRLGLNPSFSGPVDSGSLPVSWIDGRWQPPSASHEMVTLRNPADWSECLDVVPLGQANDVERAVASAVSVQAEWSARSPENRRAILKAWADRLDRLRTKIITLLAHEVGKPHADGASEVDYALDLLNAAARAPHEPEISGDNLHIRRCPLGTVGLITPWNNPVALPVAKIAAALAWGNTVVWKPALQAPRLALLLIESLAEAELPSGCVNLVFGSAGAAQRILSDPRIAASSFTGSLAAGRQVAALCALHGKPLQAELGGNNAALVTARCDLDEAAKALAEAAYAFAGQRCTAIRRLIVERSVVTRFTDAFLAVVSSLRLGDPLDPTTRIGPLISRQQQARMAAIVEEAVAQGGEVLLGGRIPPAFTQGCWFEPTVLSGMVLHAAVVQEESFGPIVVLSQFEGLADGLKQLNGVPQGLLAALYSHDGDEQRLFLRGAQAGILRINENHSAIDPQAPFGGWKASGLGLPEHGTWDREFYTRPQAVYGRLSSFDLATGRFYGK